MSNRWFEHLNLRAAGLKYLGPTASCIVYDNQPALGDGNLSKSAVNQDYLLREANHLGFLTNT